MAEDRNGWIIAMAGDAQTLSVGDLIDLAALGLLSERPQPPDDVVTFVKNAGGLHFSPTADVVMERLGRLVELGYAIEESTAGISWLQITESGRARLVRLLHCDTDPSAAALSQLCTVLKLCFLDLLAPALRREVADSLLAASEGRRRDLERLCVDACRCPAVERCLTRAVAREDAELAWLRGILSSESDLADELAEMRRERVT